MYVTYVIVFFVQICLLFKLLISNQTIMRKFIAGLVSSCYTPTKLIKTSWLIEKFFDQFLFGLKILLFIKALCFFPRLFTKFYQPAIIRICVLPKFGCWKKIQKRDLNFNTKPHTDVMTCCFVYKIEFEFIFGVWYNEMLLSFVKSMWQFYWQLFII